jgi:site-specific DNA recombinase
MLSENTGIVNKTRYFLYARKSTDIEDKQVRSIGDQLSVLHDLAKREGLHIIREFTEKQTAKKPGRPIFNDMMKRLESGEAQGVLCWKLDRLSRNPSDDGWIRWLHQIGTIRHVRTHERDYVSGENTLLMAVEFASANQYVIDLGATTKRSLDEKVKRGEYPSRAPIGYLNDRVKKTIVIDRAVAKAVRAAFELYAQGNSRLEDISAFFAKHHIYSKNGKPLKRDRIAYILSNPFYIGLFRYNGELHEGNHPPLISKELFDKVQKVLTGRGKPQHKLENQPMPLCGLLYCVECGCAITGEEKIKRQKNGNVHRYVYYRCTKKKGRCSQPCIREEILAGKLDDEIKTYAMSEDLAAGLLKMTDADEVEASQSSATASQAMRVEVEAVSGKLQRLHRLYLDQDIEREVYLSEKADLLSRKKSLEEKIGQIEKEHLTWLEPLRDWIKEAQTLEETAVSLSLPPKKSSAQKIFGSNLFLNNRLLVSTPTPPYASLREARKNFGENETSLIMERVTGVEPVS